MRIQVVGSAKFAKKNMRKTFLGVKLKTLREQRGLTQAAMAQQLKLSPSYLNQLENNQRPLSVAVLLRLQSSLGVDLQYFSEDDEARLTAQLQEIVAETALPGGVPAAELRTLAQQMPAMAQLLIRLHRRTRGAEERVATLALGLGGRDGEPLPASPQPHEEVRDFFYARHNYMAALDERAEARHEQLLAEAGLAAAHGASLVALLEAHLARAHGIAVETVPAEQPQLRRYDPARRLL